MGAEVNPETVSRGTCEKPAAIRHQPDDGRLAWVDHAKAICIVAVVVMYCTHHVQQIMQTTGWMQEVVEFAQPFRMPDFFLIAGLFATRVLSRPWRAYIDSKVLYFMYFYAVWASFRFVYLNLGGLLGPERLTLLPDYLRLFIEPPSGPLWFIYVLALFFLAIRALRAWPAWLILIGAIALHLAQFKTGITLFDKFAYYFVFFYSGCLFAPQIFLAARWSQKHVYVALAMLSLWFAGNALVVDFEVITLPGVALLAGYAGAFAVMLAATLLCRLPWMGWFRWLGQHSIIVYLGFVVPLGFMRMFIANARFISDAGTWSLIATVASIGGAVLLYLAARKTPLRFLFERPNWVSVDVSHLALRSDIGTAEAKAKIQPD